MVAATCLYLSEELWERIFKFLNNHGDISIYEDGRLDLNNHQSMESLSLVSKQFLSITNRLRFLVKISGKTIPFLHRLFQRFPNVTSLNITLSSHNSGLNALLTQISTFPLDIKSLILYRPIMVPADGLLAFSKKMKNLTSLTCYQVASMIDENDLFFIADYFPLLEELILTNLSRPRVSRLVADYDDEFLALPKLRKIALSHNIVGGHQSIIDLCKNCDLLQEIKVITFIRRYLRLSVIPILQVF